MRRLAKIVEGFGTRVQDVTESVPATRKFAGPLRGLINCVKKNILKRPLYRRVAVELGLRMSILTILSGQLYATSNTVDVSWVNKIMNKTTLVTTIAMLLGNTALEANALSGTVKGRRQVVLAMRLQRRLQQRRVTLSRLFMSTRAGFLILFTINHMRVIRVRTGLNGIYEIRLITINSGLLKHGSLLTNACRGQHTIDVINTGMGTIVATRLLRTGPRINLRVLCRITSIGHAVNVERY